MTATRAPGDSAERASTSFRPNRPSNSGARSSDRVRDRPSIRELATEKQSPDMSYPGVSPRVRSERLNRAVNLVLAASILIAALPLLLAVAILIKLTSRGPILYIQTRVGLDRRDATRRALAYDRRVLDLGGRVFAIYKVRSMYVDAEQRSGAVWATRGDSRVTPLGRIIRKCRIDEIPQLINVLKGDMNIVGPRPERPSIFARLREGIPDYPARQRAKPGITGWAQVNQGYDACVDDVKNKVRYDLEYVQRQGLAEDVRIMAKTVPVVLFRWTGW